MRIGFLIVVGILTSILLVGCGAESKAEGKDENKGQVLKLVSYFPVDHPFTKDIIPMWMKKIEEGTDGEIQFDWVGGPESIAIDEQFIAVQRGLVDIGFLSTAGFLDSIPSARAMYLSSLSPTDMRENGFFDFYVEKFKEQDVEYIGRWINGPHHFWVNKEVDSIEDFKGLKLRSNPLYHRIQTSLGMVPVTIAPGDVYTSLERGMVDGFAFPLIGPRDNGWTEVTEYFIDEPLVNTGSSIVFNGKTLNSLTAENQEKITKLTLEFEDEMIAYFKEKEEEESEVLKDEGVKFIKMSEMDGKDLREIAQGATWEEIEEKVSSEDLIQLKKFLNAE